MGVSVFPAPSTGSTPLTFSGRGTVSTNIPAGTYKYTCNGNVTLGGQLIEPGSGLISFSSQVTSGDFGGTGLSFVSVTGQISPGGSSIGAMAVTSDGSRILIGRSSALGISTDNASWTSGSTGITIENIATTGNAIIVNQQSTIAWSTNLGSSWTNTSFGSGSTVRNGAKWGPGDGAWLVLLNRSGTSEVCILTNPSTNGSFSQRSTAASTVTWNTPYSLTIGHDNRAVVAINDWTSGIRGRVTWHSTGNSALENWNRFTTGSNVDYTNGVYYVSALNRYYGFSSSSNTFWYAPQSTAFSSTWTSGSVPDNAGGASIREIMFGNGVYLMLLQSQQYAYRSTDGLNWTRVTVSATPAGSNLEKGVFFNGKFIVGGVSHTGSTFSSSDGITWTQDSLLSNTVQAGASDGTIHVLTDSANIAVYNGSSWSLVTSPTNQNSVRDIVFANGLFVLVAQNGGIFTSTNGTSWTSRGIDTNDNQSVSFGNGVWVVTDAVGNIKTTSPGSLTFVQRVAGGSSAGMVASVFTGSQFLVFTNGVGTTASSNIWYSQTGIGTWNSSGFSNNWQTAAGYYAPVARFRNRARFINNRLFIAGNNYDTVSTTWASVSELNQIEPKIGAYFAAGDYTNGIYVRSNGHSLEFGVNPKALSGTLSASANTINSFAAGNNVIFAGHNNGIISRYDVTGNSVITLEKVA